MTDFNAQDANTALHLLSEVALQREEEISNYNIVPDQDESDNEADSPCPYFDQFFENGGTTAIIDMCNFDANEFELLWQLVETHVTQNYNTGRGKKSHVSGKDMLFMFLTTLKHGGHWDILGRVFKIKGPTFERMMTKYVAMISSYLYDLLVTKISSEFSMSTLTDAQQKFRQFPEALYAVDVTFQQSYRPSGSLQEGKIFFSGKHKLYGIKVEVCVLPNGLAINCSNHYPGSVSDFEIIQRRKDVHEKILKRRQMN